MAGTKREADGQQVSPADLVLEGGGIKGIALAGAVGGFAKAGYAFQRIAGTSAGAIVGAVVAALERSGEPVERVQEIAATLDYGRFKDRGNLGGAVDRVGLGFLVDGFSLALQAGAFEGKYLHDWLGGVLADLGVRTFGDLRLPPDPTDDLPAAHRYRLVVVASDVSRRRMVRLPWDYPDYGLDPDEQSVADAVRASASIPFFFEPVTLRGAERYGASTLVDGGMLWRYPITIFDRTDGLPPRWPTFGVRLSSRPSAVAPSHSVRGPLSLAVALVETMLEAHNAQAAIQPCSLARTTFVDTSSVSAIDFAITPEQQQTLLAAGAQAVQEFLRVWNFESYSRDCRGGPQ